MSDKETIRPVACGYGLLGLCCDSCLHGPCRRSPFDDAAGGGPCWEDGNWIVANHLMERVALESLRAMAAYRDSVEPASDFLSPKGAFPFFHSGEAPVGSWMATLLDAMPRLPARREPEAILTDALRLSAMALAVEALARESTGTATAETDLALPDPPSPILLLVSDEDGIRDDGREARETQETQERLMNRIDRACRKAAGIYRLPHAALLPAFARRVYAKWGLPVSMTGCIAVVCSSSMIRGLGALALGFSLVSLPGYPIQGSPLVEKYLTRDLKSRFGHAYLAVPPREDPCEAIIRSLTA